jgi:putative transposase
MFWMDESYDHIVRDAKELSAFRNYIAQNPDKAGLRSEEYSLHLRDVLIT